MISTGNPIHDCRLLVGMSQADLAAAAGIEK